MGSSTSASSRDQLVTPRSTPDREQMTMLAIVAAVLFLFCAFGLDHLSIVHLGWLGLAFLAVHVAYPWAPWRRTA